MNFSPIALLLSQANVHLSILLMLFGIGKVVYLFIGYYSQHKLNTVCRCQTKYINQFLRLFIQTEEERVRQLRVDYQHKQLQYLSDRFQQYVQEMSNQAINRSYTHHLPLNKQHEEEQSPLLFDKNKNNQTNKKQSNLNSSQTKVKDTPMFKSFQQEKQTAKNTNPMTNKNKIQQSYINIFLPSEQPVSKQSININKRNLPVQAKRENGINQNSRDNDKVRDDKYKRRKNSGTEELLKDILKKSKSKDRHISIHKMVQEHSQPSSQIQNHPKNNKSNRFHQGELQIESLKSIPGQNEHRFIKQAFKPTMIDSKKISKKYTVEHSADKYQIPKISKDYRLAEKPPKKMVIFQPNQHEFGLGLQGITERKNVSNDINPAHKQSDLIFDHLMSTLSKEQNQDPNQKINEMSPFRSQSSNFSPNPSNISKGKKWINQRINQLQKRQTGRKFFKRPSSVSYSQEYLKSNPIPGSDNKQNPKKGQPKKGQRQVNVNSDSLIAQMSQKPSASIKKSAFNMQQYSSLSGSNNGQQNKQNQTTSVSNFRHTVNPNIRSLQLEDHSDHEGYQARQQLNLSFSHNLNSLIFRYNGGHASSLSNSMLKIKNLSRVKMFVKIKCTSPTHYQIRPVSFKSLEPLQILSFTIELKLSSRDIDPNTMKHDLSRYKKDKFKVCYISQQIHHDIEYQEGERTLPVVIEQTLQERMKNQTINKTKRNQEQQLLLEEKEIEVYKRMTEKNNSKIGQIDQKVKERQKGRSYLGYFTKGLFIVVGVTGILLGLCIG